MRLSSPSPPFIGRKIPFEELLYYAAIQRKKDDQFNASSSSGPIDFKSSRIGGMLGLNGEKKDIADTSVVEVDDEKARTPSPVTLDERAQARRAIRTATWINIFYLITTE